MSISDFIKQHVHEAGASITATTASFVIPYQDMVERTVVGIAIGIGTWVATRTISWVIIKIKSKLQKCSCDSCQE